MDENRGRYFRNIVWINNGLDFYLYNGGATVVWNPKFALEGNITYQYDENYDTENMYALNIILHIFFEKQQKKTRILY